MRNLYYADVEYLGLVYLDAELKEDCWFFEDSNGGVFPFLMQTSVHAVNSLSSKPRHPRHESGHTMDIATFTEQAEWRNRKTRKNP
jgi:hypothetical protein